MARRKKRKRGRKQAGKGRNLAQPASQTFSGLAGNSRARLGRGGKRLKKKKGRKKKSDAGYVARGHWGDNGAALKTHYPPKYAAPEAPVKQEAMKPALLRWAM